MDIDTLLPGLLRSVKGGVQRVIPGFKPYLKSILGDRRYVELGAFLHLEYWPNSRDPVTFNEKILHRKLASADPRFAVVEDKVAVREYVRSQLGTDLARTVLPALIGVYGGEDDPDLSQLDPADLPETCVIKPSHMSGKVILKHPALQPDLSRVRDICDQWLHTTYGQLDNQYWYADMTPRIMVEEWLGDDEGHPPADYKFYVFDGHVEYVHVDADRFSLHRRRFYDRDWTPQQFTLAYELAPVTPRPSRFDEMVQIAEKLGAGFEFIRVDLYEVSDGSVRFGEMTVAPESGAGKFTPTRMDAEFGEHWN
jgi:hypothetical protein